MKITTYYRIEHDFEEGYQAFRLSNTEVVGCWKLETSMNPTLSTVAEVASDILCNQFTCLKNEDISTLHFCTTIGKETKSFEWQKGYSKQRIIDELAKSIWVN